MMRNMPISSALGMGWIASIGLLVAGKSLETPAVVVAGLGLAGLCLAREAVRRWLS